MEQQERIQGDAQMSMTPQVPEKRLALVHRVLISDADYPKEYAVLVTDRRSIHSTSQDPQQFLATWRDEVGDGARDRR